MDMRLFFDGWRGGGPPHRRLDRMLRALAPDDGAEAPGRDTLGQDTLGQDTLGQDTLGMRNQRLLRLHADLGGGPLEAVAKCPACATVNEFALPGDLLLALPAPTPDAAAMIGGVRFRLPRMDDLLSDDPRPLAERCCEAAPAPSADDVARADAALGALDPAADPVFDLVCAACGDAHRAAVDIAGFVAAALDRLAARLLREVDMLASAYGWSERAIAALPAERRRRYVEMVAARGSVPSTAARGGALR